MNLMNVYLMSKYKVCAPEYISNCDEAYSFINSEIGCGLVERFLLLCMDYEYHPINYSILGIGDSEKVLVDIGELFRIALLSGAKHIIIAHNHLGSSLVPTESDIRTTKQIGYVGKLLNIQLIDSMVITANGNWMSIRKYISGLENDGLE